MERKLRAGASRQPPEREQGECSGVASSSLVEGAAAVVFLPTRVLRRACAAV